MFREAPGRGEAAESPNTLLCLAFWLSPQNYWENLCRPTRDLRMPWRTIDRKTSWFQNPSSDLELCYRPQRAATYNSWERALYSERWAQCGEKKSLSLSRRVFWYSVIFMLSMLSIGSISFPSPSLLHPSSSSLLLIFYFLFICFFYCKSLPKPSVLRWFLPGTFC